MADKLAAALDAKKIEVASGMIQRRATAEKLNRGKINAFFCRA